MDKSRRRKYLAEADLRRKMTGALHFGLGKNPKIEKVIIRWPSGRSQTLDSLAPDKLYKVTEPQ